MNILETSIKAFPIIVIISIILTIVIFVTGRLPEPKSFEERQMQKVKSIKLCQDNGLDAYQSESGDWWCEPKK